MTSKKQLERHLARHLEELALCALPRNEVANDENHSNSSIGQTETEDECVDKDSDEEDGKAGAFPPAFSSAC